MNAHVHLDAASGRDPTGTSGLRRRFIADARKRWDNLTRLARQSILDHGMLGGEIGMRNLGGAGHYSQWFAMAMRQTVMGGDGRWVGGYIVDTANMAQARAARLLNASVGPPSPVLDTLVVTTIAELQGVCDATAQQVARIAGHGVLVNASGSKMASEIAAAILKVGVGRTNAMVNWMIVKAFAAVTIEAFREAGVSHVGTQAEYIPAPVADAMADAARKTPQHRHVGTGKFVTKAVAARELRRVARTGRFRAYRQIEPGTQARAERAAAAFRKAVGEVAVETAEDDLVCQQCLRISERGPYEIDKALSLIPAHVHCRCIFVPAGDAVGLDPDA